jgi:Arc/MetJ-type ribon-helix-helix transcriptional regulator
MSRALSPETQALIEERMKRGGYSSADDMVRVALDVLNQVEHEPIDDREIADIRASLDQMKRGQIVDWKHFSSQHRAKPDDD